MTAINTAPYTPSMRHLTIMYSSNPSHRSSTITVIYRLHRLIPPLRRCRPMASRSARVKYFPGYPLFVSFFFNGCSFLSALLDFPCDKIHVKDLNFHYLGFSSANTSILECIAMILHDSWIVNAIFVDLFQDS